MVDGIVDLDLSGEVVEDALVKRLRVRKMSDVLAVREWKTYEFVPGQGVVVVADEEGTEGDEDAGSESSGSDSTEGIDETAESAVDPTGDDEHIPGVDAGGEQSAAASGDQSAEDTEE